MQRVILVISCAVLFTACGDDDAITGPGQSVPGSRVIHHESGFHFLPPIMPQSSYTGVFAPALNPVVEICELNGAECALSQPAGFPIRFDTSSGPGLEKVMVQLTDEHYQADWHTSDFLLDDQKFYRIRVSVDDRVLGFADLDVTSSGSGLKSVNTNEYIPLKDGRTLPIKFRIEQAVPHAVADNHTAVTGITLSVPAGAGTSMQGLLVNDDPGRPAGAITAFGGGSLGGEVADHTAGTTADFAGGTLVVFADGSFELREPRMPGTFTFAYRLTNSSGSSDAVVSIAVAGDTERPTAVIEAPSAVSPGAAFTLSGASSHDAGGGVIASYVWRLPDGTTTQMPATEPTLTIDGLPVGRYEFQLMVVDNSGNQSMPVLASIIVADQQAPTAIITAAESGFVLDSFTLSGASSFDVGGGEIVIYRWTLPDGTVVEQPASEPTLTVPNLRPGEQVFQLSVIDNSGNVSQPAQVTVTGLADQQAPTAIITAPESVASGTAFTLSGASSFDVGGGEIAIYRWTLPDGTVVERPASEPVLTNPGLPAGEQVFQLSVIDNSGNVSQPAQVTITVL